MAFPLRQAGYVVHRTPSEVDLTLLVARLRPCLVVIALDLPWGDAVATVLLLLCQPNPVQLLLLGDSDDMAIAGVPRLPRDPGDALLLTAVRRLLQDSPHGSL